MTEPKSPLPSDESQASPRAEQERESDTSVEQPAATAEKAPEPEAAESSTAERSLVVSAAAESAEADPIEATAHRADFSDRARGPLSLLSPEEEEKEPDVDGLLPDDVQLSQEMGIQGTLEDILKGVAGLTESQVPASFETSDLPSEEPSPPKDEISPASEALKVMAAAAEGSAEEVAVAAEEAGEPVPTPVVGEEGWEESFAALPAISSQDAMERLRAGEVLRGVRVPFLTFVNEELPHPLRLESCELVGIAGHGVTFAGGIALQSCRVQERVLVGLAKREEPPVPSRVMGEVQLENCHFADRVVFYRATLECDVQVTQCTFAQALSLDRSNVDGMVALDDTTLQQGVSMFRACVSQHVNLRNCKLRGTKKIPALDMKRMTVKGGMRFLDCEFQGGVELTRSHFGDDVYRAWDAENCRFEQLAMGQLTFHGEVRLQSCSLQGKLLASPPKAEHGHAIGRSLVFEADVTFGECEFLKSVSFQHARFCGQAVYSHCLFKAGGSFNQAEFLQGVSFWESVAEDSLHFRKACFKGKANFGNTQLGARSSFNEADFQGVVTFFAAQFDGDVFFSGATFADKLKMGRLQAQGGVVLQRVAVAGELNLLQANIADRLIMAESELGSLEAPGLRVGTWASLADATVRGDVSLGGCHVGDSVLDGEQNDKYVPGSFYMNNAVLHGHLKMTGAVVKGDLSLKCVNAHKEVEMLNVRVGHELCFSKGYFRDVLRCDQTTCKERLLASLTRFRDEVSFNAIEARSVSLGASSFDQGFTMRGATIKDVLALNNVDVDGKADLSKCSFGRFFFDHLLVDYLMVEREQLGERLASEEAGNFAQAKNEYGILRQAFLVRNRYQDMDWAYYRFCQASRKEKPQGLTTFLEWLLFDLGFGYGTRPMNIAGVALGIVLIFAAMFFAFPQGIVTMGGQTLSHLNLLDSLHLSVLTFASMEYSAHQAHAVHWLKYLFAVEGLLGIFLITLFVATISRKIIRT